MTRAKDISKIVTDADLSGTLDVTGTVTAGGLDIQGDGTISGGSRLTISDIADENNDGIRLDDSTTARFNNLTQDSSGNFKIQHWTGSAWQNNFTLTTGGSVGVGTSSPSATLQVQGTTNGLQSVFGLDSSGLKISTFQKTGNDAGVILDAQESSNGTLTFATTGSERMRILSGGEVAIGGSGYSGQPFSVQTSTNNVGFMQSTGTTRAVMNFVDANSTNNVGFGCIGNNHVFMKDSTESMRIDSSGNVGIGTSSPQDIIDIRGGASSSFIFGTGVNSADSTLTLEFRDRYGTSGFGQGQIASFIKNVRDGSTGNYDLTFGTNTGTGTNASERMRITSAGNVGIGNTNPEDFGSLVDNLVVGTTSGENGITIASGTANSGRIQFADNTASPFRGAIEYAHGSTDALLFYTAGTQHMKIDSAGHVTMPFQPYFRADKNGTVQSNISSAVIVTFNNERVDTGSNYNTTTSTFTAPVTGTYVLSYSMRLQSIDSASSYYNIEVSTSNRSYNSIFSNDEWAGDVTYWSAERTIVADMDAGDTANVVIQFIGGTAQTDINGSANYTVFSGCLVS